MKIAIIGAGYVGLTSAAVFAEKGHIVRIIDSDIGKIEKLKSGGTLFFEPELPELIGKNIKNKKLIPELGIGESINSVDAIFICVGTPTQKDGECDLTQVFSAAKEIGKNLKNRCVIVMKSTVPVGTTEKVAKIIEEQTTAEIDVASCPEFLREGSAIKNTLHPDRIVVGVNSENAKKILLEIHKDLPGERVVTDIRTAEMIKYASNAFLATKISFINEIANLCDEVNSNVEDVALAMGLDPRIGKDFLKAGIGYGGSCFPKDTRALQQVALSNNYNFKLLKAVIEVNNTQRLLFLEKVKRAVGKITGKKIGVLGLAFKNNTDDVRESAAIDIMNWIIKGGADVIAYDPKAMANAKMAVKGLKTCDSGRQVAKNADAILLLTEWDEFKSLPWEEMKKEMKDPIIVDGRNLLNPAMMRKMGFKYFSVGRP